MNVFLIFSTGLLLARVAMTHWATRTILIPMIHSAKIPKTARSWLERYAYLWTKTYSSSQLEKPPKPIPLGYHDFVSLSVCWFMFDYWLYILIFLSPPFASEFSPKIRARCTLAGRGTRFSKVSVARWQMRVWVRGPCTSVALFLFLFLSADVWGKKARSCREQWFPR